MSTISTHVLDTALGHPAPGIPVHLHQLTSAALVGSGTTDADGRVTDFACGQLEPGNYQLRFDVAEYGAATGQELFFPEISVTFTITDERHYHVPLLLSPFAFSTYRGS
ncbi:hydroxyisourate hydrolase [Kribbella qitaiheensis]|uniref:5-hydroxyisourate hydrolase n=1 Tax=Kribbella qitaiheensis TaxID=1544730 RepID=A0A7G6WS35_9ACTN|nr:hydroxyisourate hydrolase [Kribbella qitaiheensis]QNE16800.1 hydroxyisourate hydrolase [Kribbella qitaiheensis]